MKKLSILLFLSLFAFTSCNKDEIETEENKEEEGETTDPGATEPTSYFMTYTVDGETSTIENTVGNYGIGTTLGGGADPNNGLQTVVTEARIEKWKADFSGLEQYCGLGFGEYTYQLADYNSNGKDELAQILAIKSHVFKMNATPGAYVSYYANDAIWTSEDVQQGSNATVTITESEPGTFADGKHFRTVKGTFSNITMENENGSATKVITDGKFHLQFLPRTN